MIEQLKTWMPKSLSRILTLFIGFALLVLGGTLIFISAASLRNQGEQTGIQKMRTIAAEQGMHEGAFFWRAYGATAVLAKQMLLMQERGNHRDSATLMVRATLEANPDFVGISTGWEPNAFDNDDATWAGTKCHDATGRFIPYWSRSADGFVCDPLVDYEKPVAGDYYLLPRSSGKDMLIDAYAYPVGGVTVLMATVVSVIQKNGAFLGVTTADINLAPLQAKADSFKDFEGQGRLTVIGGTGIIAAQTGNPKAITQSFSSINPVHAKDLQAAISEGKEWIDLSSDTLRVAIPLNVIEGDKPWCVLVEAPREIVLKEANARTTFLLIVGLLLLLSILVVSLVIIKKLMSPLSHISLAAEKLSKGDVDAQIPSGSPGELGVLENSFLSLADYFRTRCQDAETIAKGNLFSPIKPASPKDMLGIALEKMRTDLQTSIKSLRTCADEFVTVASALGTEGKLIETATSQTAKEVSSLDSSMRSIEGSILSVTEGTQILAQKLNEILVASNNTNKASDTATQQAISAETQVHELHEASQRVESVIQVIKSVADQTRLLALNATIEAASAGEAGKGFAVVASEVKDLALRTANATSEISTILEGIRSTSQNVGQSIGGVRASINVVGTATKGILDVVSDQQEKVRQMAVLAKEGDQSLRIVSQGLGQARDNANQAAIATSGVRIHADDVKRSSDTMSKQIEIFHI